MSGYPDLHKVVIFTKKPGGHGALDCDFDIPVEVQIDGTLICQPDKGKVSIASDINGVQRVTIELFAASIEYKPLSEKGKS